MGMALYSTLAMAVLLLVISGLVPLADRLRLPLTVLLAGLGVALGAFAFSSSTPFLAGIFGDVFLGFSGLDLHADTYLLLFLPPLLFTAGLLIDVRRLFDEAAAVLLLAVVAVGICTVIVGYSLALFSPVGIVGCLLLGAVIATTDPAAVVALFRDLGAPRRLVVLVEGESVLNDAAAIALFGILTGVLVGDAVPGVGSALLLFCKLFVGGIVFGWALARLACWLLTRLDGSAVAEATVTISLAYLSYVIGESYLEVSGVVAVAAAALTVAAYGPLRLAPRNWASLVDTWFKIEFWASSLVFVLAAMYAMRTLSDLTFEDLLLLTVVIVATYAARALVLYGMLPVLEAARFVEAVDHRYRAVILWGGLRGSMTLVLALAVAENEALPADVRHLVAVVATGYVLVTLIIAAPTLRPLLRVLGLDRLSPVEAALRNRVFVLSQAALRDRLGTVARDYGLDPVLAERLTLSIEATADVESDLSEGQRLQVGLLTLATREKELFLQHFEERTISRRLAALLVAGADRLIDRVKTAGADAYEGAAMTGTRFRPDFRVALWLQRRLRWSGPLSRRLEDRFETLLISRLVLRECAAFTRGSLRDILGQDTASALDRLMAARLDAIEGALQALELQYSNYAELLATMHLTRAALRMEEADYDLRFRESLISREVRDALLGDLQTRRAALDRRPPLDLGLKLAEMMRRVPIFEGLDAAELVRLGRMLRPTLATPGERIVTLGERGDCMYFVAAGVVEVRRGARRVPLEAGDFFGELALLHERPRNADVVALGYCHLLVLERPDFRRLLRANPNLRGEIERVAEARLREPSEPAAPAATP